MTLFIIGLSVTLIINALLLLLIRKHFIYNLKRHNELTRGLFELQKEFTDYQVNQKRYNNKTITQREIRFDNVAKSIQKNEDRIHLMKKSLPEEIRKTIGHIEFAKPLDKK
jgi:hypothetical protein|tara:strand:- start:62 stop:394 length:333 start_codon:yes stop_codon:yes gene_type:complete